MCLLSKYVSERDLEGILLKETIRVEVSESGEFVSSELPR